MSIFGGGGIPYAALRSLLAAEGSAPSSTLMLQAMARRASILKGLSLVADLGRGWNSFSTNPFNAGLSAMYKKQAIAVADATDLVLVYTNWAGSPIASAAPVNNPIYLRAGVGDDVDTYPGTWDGGKLTELPLGPASNAASGLFASTDPIAMRIYAGQKFPVGTYVRVDQLVGTGNTHSNTTIDNFSVTSGGIPYKGQFIVSAGNISAGATITSVPVLAAGVWSFTISSVALTTASGVAITANGSWPISGTLWVAEGDAGSASAGTATDRTGDTSLLTMTSGGQSLGYYPAAILGRSPGLNRAMIAVVDSLGCGSHDNTPAKAFATATGMRRLGFIERTWGDDGVVAVGVGGMRPSDLTTPATTAVNGAKMVQAQKFAAGATGVFFELATNNIIDYPGALTIAQIEANLLKLWSRFAGDRFIPGWAMTVIPRPASSTDAWLTTGNQTLAVWEPARLAVNRWMRDGAPIDTSTSPYSAVAVGTVGASIARCPYLANATGAWITTAPSPGTATINALHPLALGGVVEIADLLESARDSGLWKSAAWLATGNTHTTTTIDGVVTTSGAFTTDPSGNAFLLAGTGIPANDSATLSGSTLTLVVAASATAAGVTLGQPYTDDGTHPLDIGHLLLQARLAAPGSGTKSARQIIRDSMNG